MRGTLMSINYFRQYELRNRDIVTLAPAHEVNGISIIRFFNAMTRRYGVLLEGKKICQNPSGRSKSIGMSGVMPYCFAEPASSSRTYCAGRVGTQR